MSRRPDALPPGPTVDVWLVAVPDAADPSVLDAVRGHLDDWEEERLGRLRRMEDQARYAAAHALVRVALSAAGGTPPQEWHLAVAPDGKPLVSAPAAEREVQFSLSHTPGLVGCAVARGVPVGFDVEALDRRLRVDALARHTLTPSELESRPAEMGSAASAWFLRYWTLKEALLKATGTGLRISPKEVELAAAGPGPAEIVSLPPAYGDIRGWQVHSLEAMDAHVAAVAVRADAATAVDVRPRGVALADVLAEFGR